MGRRFRVFPAVPRLSSAVRWFRFAGMVQESCAAVARGAVYASTVAKKCSACMVGSSGGRTERDSRQFCWQDMRPVHARARGRTHAAQFTPPAVARNALRESRWQDSRSVHSGNARKRRDMRSVHAIRNAQGAYPATTTHAAHFVPAQVAGNAPRAFPRSREDARNAIYVSSDGRICAPCIPGSSRERTQRNSRQPYLQETRSVYAIIVHAVRGMRFAQNGTSFTHLLRKSLG